MNKFLIIQHIKSLNKKDIINYCTNQGIMVNMSDIDIIYEYIKNDYMRFFENPDNIFNEIKGKISEYSYIVLKELYERYKRFI